MPVSRGILRSTDTVLAQDEILKYGANGAEGSESIIIDRSVVAADGDGKKVLAAGSLLVKMTSGANVGAYGPYASGATDGRQTLGVAPNCVILSADWEVTEVSSDPVIGGYYAAAHFDAAKLTLFGASLANVKAAFPTCFFL